MYSQHASRKSFTTTLLFHPLPTQYQFRVDRNIYHLSVDRLFLLNLAYGFILGAFSFLMLCMFSYRPVGALICSVPLSLALVVVFGLPIFYEEAC